MAINHSIDDCWDWQVTVTFYSALHLIDAHVTRKTNEHYRSHDAIRQALNPYTHSPAALDESGYIAYESLFKLSRRSRYLVSEKHNHKPASTFLTYEKHLARAIRHLDSLMSQIGPLYKIEFPEIKIKCKGLKEDELKVIRVT